MVLVRINYVFYKMSTRRYKFTDPNGQERFYRIRIAPSGIPDSGDGAYAVDAIPKGSRMIYRGKRYYQGQPGRNDLYSWAIIEYDEKTGKPYPDGRDLFYVDATNPRNANWTRWANTGPTRKSNQWIPHQIAKTMWYVASRDIRPGEELFIDYGPDYRHSEFGLYYQGEK